MNDDRYIDYGYTRQEKEISRFDVGSAAAVLAFAALILGNSAAGSNSASEFAIRALLAVGAAAGAIALFRATLLWGSPLKTEATEGNEPIDFQAKKRNNRETKAA